MNWTTYWWGIVGEDSPLGGDQFFTELPDNADEDTHAAYAMELFPSEELVGFGFVDEDEAEEMGLDTY